MALIQAGTALEGIQGGQNRQGHGIQLTGHAALGGNGHGKGSQVVEASALQPSLTEPARPLETAVVGLATLQGSIHEQGRLPLPRAIPLRVFPSHPSCPPADQDSWG
jgi:hypothetical protein